MTSMSIQERAHITTGFPEIGKKRENSLELNRVLDETVDWLMEQYPVTKKFTANFFLCDIKEVNDTDVEFFDKYARLSIKQILAGALNYRLPWNKTHKAKIRTLTERDINSLQAAAPAGNDSIYHEVAHSIFALISSNRKKSISSLMPEFQKRFAEGLLSSKSWREELMVSGVLFDKYYASSNFGHDVKGEGIIEDIKKSSNLKEFVYIVFKLEDTPGPLMMFNRVFAGTPLTNGKYWALLDGIFKNYENDRRYILDSFIKAATPIVKRYENA